MRAIEWSTLTWRGEKKKYVIKHGYYPKKMPQIDEKRKGETGNGLRKSKENRLGDLRELGGDGKWFWKISGRVGWMEIKKTVCRKDGMRRNVEENRPERSSTETGGLINLRWQITKMKIGQR